jgi:Holliday junction resolvase RusA-like endonuclease
VIDLSFELPLSPPSHTAQQTGERAVVGADGRAFVIHYRKRENVRIEREYLEALRPHVPRVPLRGPVALAVGFYYTVTQTGRATMKRAGVALRRKTSKPDADNVSKALVDAMTKAGFWEDDAAVAMLHVEKYETAGRPRIAVRVRELAQFPGELFPSFPADEAEALEPA